MKWLLLGIIAFGTVLVEVPGARATEMVYTPINPSFGGNPLNGTFLLNQATAQNKFKEQNTSALLSAYSAANGSSATGSSTDPVEQFKTQLNRMLLSGLADKLIRMAFGTDAVTSGDYAMGDMKVHVDAITDPTNLTVTISNVATGSTTTITLPVYQ